MQSFKGFADGTIVEGSAMDLDILGLIKTYNGSSQVEIEDDYISTMVPSREQLELILADLPDDVDYDVLVHTIDEFTGPKTITTSDAGDDQEEYDYAPSDVDSDDDDEDGDDEDEIDWDQVDDRVSEYELIIYTYNTMDEEQIDEIRRRIKINAKGKRRIKMQCKKGYKFDGRKCVKISGGELVRKRRAIRKAVRTKKKKGSGYQKRIARLRKRAMKKRTGMGLNRKRR